MVDAKGFKKGYKLKIKFDIEPIEVVSTFAGVVIPVYEPPPVEEEVIEEMVEEIEEEELNPDLIA